MQDPFASSVFQTLLAVIVSLTTGWQAAGQSLTQPNPSEQPSVQQTNETPISVQPHDLAEDSYSRRQRATLEMWQRRDLSREEVQAAARDSDPEVASRAQWILRQWRRGALPNTPSDVSRVLGQADDSSAIEELLDSGQFGAAVVAIDESTETANRDGVRMRTVNSLHQRFPVFVVRANRDGTLGQLLQIIDLVADSKEMALTRIELMDHLGLPIDETTLMPKSSESWTQSLRDETMILLRAVRGEYDKACEIAKKSGDLGKLRTSLVLDERWEEMAEHYSELAKSSAKGSLDQVRAWALVLVAADHGQLEDSRNAAADALINWEGNESEVIDTIRWHALLLHGFVDDAISILGKQDAASGATLALAASRPMRAFELLRIDNPASPDRVAELLEEAIEAQLTIESEKPVEELERMFALMRCYLGVGRTDLAWQIAERLSKEDLNIGRVSLRDYVLVSLSYTLRDDWLVQLAALPDEHSATPTAISRIANTLPDTNEQSLRILIESLGGMYPGWSYAARLNAACQLLQGTIPNGWNASTDFDRLQKQLMTGKREIQQMGAQVVVGAAPQVTLSLVKMFARFGKHAIADSLLQQLLQAGDDEAFFEYAETQLSGGRASVASELFESIWDAVVEPRPLPQWSRGRIRDVDMGIKSLVAQWILARRASDEQTASERLAEIGLVACTPSASQRLTIAQYLGTHNEPEFASEIFAKLLPMVAYGNRDGTSHYSVANAYAFLIEKDDPSQAAAVFSSAVSLGIDSAVFFERAYVSLALLMNRWRIEGAVQRNDADQLSREFERMLRLNPLEINIPEKTFPKLKSEPLKSLAERTLNEILNCGEFAMKEMPFYATLHNNLAWIAAINATSLDKAIRWSQRAVQLEPDSVVFRDTLAEILYRSGKGELALQVERACLHDEPGEWHLHEQIKRFEAGAP